MNGDAIAHFHNASHGHRDEMIGEAESLIRWYEERIEELRSFAPDLTALTRPVMAPPTLPTAAEQQQRLALEDVTVFGAQMDAARSLMFAATDQAVTSFTARVVELRTFIADLRRVTDAYLGLPTPATAVPQAEVAGIKTIAAKFAPTFFGKAMVTG